MRRLACAHTDYCHLVTVCAYLSEAPSDEGISLAFSVN